MGNPTTAKRSRPARRKAAADSTAPTRLAESGLVTVKRIGNQKHYQADPGSPVFEELCSLVRKIVGLAGPIREALEPLGDRIRNLKAGKRAATPFSPGCCRASISR